MDAIADDLGLDRAEVRSRNFIQPDEMPYDHGLIFQDGRPLNYDSRRLPRLARQAQGAGRLGRLRRPTATQAEREGRRVGLGIGCYVEGTGVGPYEGGHVMVETSGRVNVATGLTTQGQGHQTAFAQIVADELGVRLEDVHVTTGDTRRMRYAVGTFASRAAVMSGNAIALAAREGAGQGAADRGRRPRGAPRTTSRSSTASCRSRARPTTSMPLGTVAVLSNPLRYAFDEAAKAATQFAGTVDPDKPPVADDEEPGLEGQRLLLAHPGDLRQRHARGDRRDRPGHRRDPDPALLRRARLRRR